MQPISDCICLSEHEKLFYFKSVPGLFIHGAKSYTYLFFKVTEVMEVRVVPILILSIRHVA